jgi:hypothetical protein
LLNVDQSFQAATFAAVATPPGSSAFRGCPSDRHQSDKSTVASGEVVGPGSYRFGADPKGADNEILGFSHLSHLKPRRTKKGNREEATGT